MWKAQVQTRESPRFQRVSVLEGSRALSFAEVIDHWRENADFRDYFVSLLASAPYDAYFWENPPVTTSTANRPFEFVLVESADFSRVEADPGAFQAHFDRAGPEQAVLTFPNLRGDALLVVPNVLTSVSAGPHLAAFVREAPMSHSHALWQVVGEAMADRIGERPVWLNTSGLGVSWLHVRLDSRPKYYQHQPYETAA